MATTLYLEPFSGISGDMFLGALAPLLDMEGEICSLPERLGLTNATVSFEDVERSTIRCRRANIEVHAAHAHSHDHEESHAHPHRHDHGHSHRAYTDIVHLLGHADLPEGARALALSMFHKLGEAESQMHGIPLQDIHFHEVGGEDSIIDIVGAALLLDRLQATKVFAKAICVGSGTVNTAHGRLPVPAPATQELLQGMPTYAGPVEKEMTTPTGAVILSELSPDFDVPTLTVLQSNLGAGSRNLHDQPNALRVSLCEPVDSTDTEAIYLLQSNLDNVTGEDLGADLLEQLLTLGARDAWLTPIFMKKGRPAQKLEILCIGGERVSDIRNWVFNHLPTLGIRCFEGTRWTLNRRSETVDTSFGPIRIKIHELPDGGERHVPEYEECQRAAKKAGVSLQDVRDAARRAQS